MDDNKVMTDKRQTGILRIEIAGFIMAGLYILAGLIPIDSLWGFNHLRYLPDYGMIAIGLLFIIVLIPHVSEKIFSAVKEILRIFNRFSLSVRVVAIAIMAVLVFYLLRVHVHSLGDGYQRIYQVEQGYLYYHTEVLDFFLHGILYAGLNLIGKFSGETIYTIFSIAAGTSFIISIYLFRLDDRERIIDEPLMKILLITFGGSQLFFGYAESYALFYIFSLLYILYAVRFLLSGKGLLAASIFLGLSCTSHITALILAPSFFYLAFYNHRIICPEKFPRKYIPSIIALAMIAAVIVQEILLRIYVGEYVTSVSGGYLSLWPLSEYTVFSPAHLLDVLNEILIIVPVILILAFAGFGVPSNDKHKNLNIFLSITAVSGALMMVIVDPKLGYARDWDLFSIPTAMLGLAGVIYFTTKLNLKAERPCKRFVIGALSMIFLSGWVLTNASVQGQLNRAEDLLSLDDKGRGYCTELLAYYYRYNAHNNEKSLELLQSIPGRGKNARVYYKIAKTEIDLGRHEDALESIYKGLDLDSNYAALHLMAGTILTNRGKPEQGLPHLQRAITLDQSRKEAYHTLGTAYYKLDSLDMALMIFKDIARVYPDDAMAYIEAGNMYRLLRQYDSAYFYIRQGLQINPDIAEGYQLLNAIKREMSP